MSEENQYLRAAKAVVEAVGGKENISAAQMQRLLNTNTADMGVASAVEYENLCRQTEENGIGSQFTTPLENGQTEVISLDSQGIMIKKSFDEEGNQTREFQYNPAENTRKVKTFAAKEKDEPRQNGNNPNTSETRESERPKENDA